MIDIQTLKTLGNNDGVTLKAGNPIEYKTGYQVATEGVEVTTAEEAYVTIEQMKNCGVWLSEGVYYIDKCHRVKTKREAVKEGIERNQQSIYDWKHKDLVWLK